MEHTTIPTEAGTFHALTTAPSTAAPSARQSAQGTARPLLFLHGFPDHPPTGKPFFEALAQRGHRVLAPWLRGYAPSPLDGPYDVDTLVRDAISLIDHWSPDQPVDVVGHDWGAVITYALCNAAPARIARAVTLAIPHPLTFIRQLRSPAQLRASWYMGLFQLPGSERVIRAKNYRLIDRLWRRWSPGYQLDPEQRAELHACLDASRLGPIAYYRAAVRTSRDDIRRSAQPITTPLLALHGELDGCILPPTIDDRKRFSGPYERAIVPGVGHFMHIEAPTEIADRVSAWLHGDVATRQSLAYDRA
jgi:pimeloyl-ACP methyl ester carboxylesterase